MSKVAISPGYRTMSQMIAEDLQDRISAGTLAPGERLLLKSLSEQFGCSEIPVRDALRTLQSAGLINVVPHKGAFVNAPNVYELVQLTEIRSLLEPEATIAAVPHSDAEMIDCLRAMLSEMSALVEQGDWAEYGRLNRRFHDFILDRSPNQKLVSLVKDLWGQADRARLVYMKGPEFLVESVRQHTSIVDALEQKDSAKLRQLVAAHSEFGLNAVRSLAAEAELNDNKRMQK